MKDVPRLCSFRSILFPTFSTAIPFNWKRNGGSAFQINTNGPKKTIGSFLRVKTCSKRSRETPNIIPGSWESKERRFVMIFRRVSEWPSWNWRGQWEEMEKLRRQMDVLSGGLSGRLFAETSAGVFPLMNMTEDSDHYYSIFHMTWYLLLDSPIAMVYFFHVKSGNLYKKIAWGFSNAISRKRVYSGDETARNQFEGIQWYWEAWK